MSGGDDVEDPASDPPQLLGSELAGLLDQVGLGPRDGVGVHRTREGGEGAVDDVRLRQRHPTLPHGGGEDRAVAIQRRREHQVGTRVGEPGPRLLGQPARRVLDRALRRGRVGEVAGIGEDPQPQLRQLRLRTHQLNEGGDLVVGRHERRVHTSHRLQHGPDVGDRSNNRMTHHRPPFDDGTHHAHT